MIFAARILLSLLVVSFSAEAAWAQVRWKEPEVMRVKLKRPNRRVIRFTGKTRPNATVRIRKDKIKLYLDSGRARWVTIPQKDKAQFPITASGSGVFSFRLYLPTTAVEIPVEVKSGKRWRVAKLNYRVEGSGGPADFKATEASFRAADKQVSKIDRDDNYYSRKNDQGLLIGDGKNDKKVKESKIQAWGSIGFSYFDNSIDSTGFANVSASDSTLVLPTFRIGGQWDYSNQLMLQAMIRSTSGSTEDITGGNAQVTGNDFSWVEAQIGGVWLLQGLKFKGGVLGLDFGLQYHQLPFFRERPGFANYAYFDNTMWNVYVGLNFQKRSTRSWGYEAYARYVYPVTSGDAFDMNTSFPLMFEFGGGAKKRFTESMSFGVYTQLDYFSLATKYSNTNPARNYEVDLTLLQLTVDARVVVHF